MKRGRRGHRRLTRIVDDEALLRRTGRIAALQSALALGVVLLLVGTVAYLLDVHAQAQEISGQLSAVVARTDDVTDAPPGMAPAPRRRYGVPCLPCSTTPSPTKVPAGR